MDAGELTLEEFMAALNGIAKVRDELRPKTREEVMAEVGKNVTAMQEKNREAKIKARANGQ